MDETSPKYIANRPCYSVRTERRLFRSVPASQVLIEDTQLYWHGSYASQSEAPALTVGKKYRFENGVDVFECKGYATVGRVYYDIIGNASLVAEYIGLIDDGLGNPVPNTGEDWAYVTGKAQKVSSMFAKTKNYKANYNLYEVTENVKKLERGLLPDEAVLPAVGTADSGKYLRVTSDGVWAVEESVVIPSSTSGSIKRFKITVDDTGKLSATEVTT